MNKEEIPFIDYNQLLKQLESSKNENNLLLGNGFNLSLGVKTDYKNILDKMKKDYSIYEDLEENECDIETIIGTLKSETKNKFLKKFISDKIKLDFMKSANEIVKDSIKNIYKEKNEEIHLLFKNFINYFSLNYDPLLYLLLMNFKKPEQTIHSEQPMLAFHNTIKYKQTNLTEEEQKIYAMIKNDYENGQLTYHDKIIVDMGGLKKPVFYSVVKEHLKAKQEKLTDKTLKRLCNLLWEEKKENIGELTVYDGFRDDLFETAANKKLKYIEDKTQNLFFLHGTFYFYQKGKEVFKITSKQHKALYERLEDIISNEHKEIVCVFKDTDKLHDINANTYLKNSYEKLKTLKGSMVIIGSAFSENDNHIFKAINDSSIKNIYISCFEKDQETFFRNAKEYFKDKNIILFDIETISYNKKTNHAI